MNLTLRRWRPILTAALAVPTAMLILSFHSTALAQTSTVSIVDLPPGNGSVLSSQTVTLRAMITENGAAVDPAKITLLVDGENHGAISYDSTTFTAQRIVTVGQGTHTALFRVIDTNSQMVERSYTFTVDTLVPSVSVQLTNGKMRTNQIPVTITLTPADDPSGRASGVTEMQVAFDGVIDNESWEPFQTTVIRDLMNKEGLQALAVRVRDLAGNISETAYTTVTYEVTPNMAPVNALSSTVGNTVTLAWEPVVGATGYVVRYNDGQTVYGPLTTTNSALVINNLDLSKSFHFEVAELNPAGSTSEFTAILTPEAHVVAEAKKVAAAQVVIKAEAAENQTPSAAATTTSPSISPTSKPRTSPTPSAKASPSPSAAVSPSPSASPSTSSDQTKQPRDWTRVIVALSILIIAAGVATGGWYLYQWWTTRPSENKGKKGRW